jgi:DNA mismatch repair protein MutS
VVRYVTTDLLQVESELINSASLALELEREIFHALCAKVAEQADAIQMLALAVAKLDVFSALAQLAYENDYVKPVVDDSCVFHIRDGRHPMVERSSAGRFTPNGCTLDNNQKIWLMTGPNMAGKSTFLRQNALLAIMAHMGSFVPASYAHIGAIDKVFSRVGAGDDISRGQSTFMVEMVETANVINNATTRSFVILDEIGRGTATYDGLAIAKAVIEHISKKIGCRTLFATHYHELTELELLLPMLACYTLAVQDNGGAVSFLHQVVPGKAERSYGIHVASLAGMPATVVDRAVNILQELEESDNMPASSGSDTRERIADCTAHDVPYGAHNDNQQVVQMLRQAEPEALSPREALELIYKIKEMMK